MLWSGMLVGAQAPLPVEVSSAQRFLRWVMDPRFILIRALAVMYAVGGFFPTAFQSAEPQYVLLAISSNLLMLCAGFVPVLAGITSAGLFLVFLTVYPHYLNPFDAPIEFAAAALLASLRWWQSIAMAATVVALTLYSTHVNPGLALPFSVLIWNLAFYSLLALLGIFLASRIDKETALREQEARAHEHRIRSIREGFVIDTHDTVSHGLAAQASLMRVLAAEREPEEQQQLLERLMRVNEQSQLQLRTLLAKLSIPAGSERLEPATVPSSKLRRETEALAETAAASGFRLAVRFEVLPPSLAPDLVEHASALARELVTNMLKHAGEREGELRLHVENDELRIESWNRGALDIEEAPRSLALRAEALGGKCIASERSGSCTVTVTLPLSI